MIDGGSNQEPISFFYSVRSVYAYFAARRIADLARRHGRRLEHCPIDLSQVVPAFGSQPFGERSPQVRALQFRTEVRRWSEYLEMPVLLDPVHHHGDRLSPSALILAAQAMAADADSLAAALLTALWRDDRDIASVEVQSDLARACGIEPAPLLERAGAPGMLANFQRCTDRAIALGVPGSPSFLVDGELFYGQDRLMFVERQLVKPFGRV
jgi:2-hydroxychromene-2-carboxylate isomerase